MDACDILLVVLGWLQHSHSGNVSCVSFVVMQSLFCTGMLNGMCAFVLLLYLNLLDKHDLKIQYSYV